MKLAFYFS